MKNLSTILKLCTCLVATNKSEVYNFINKLLYLIMTLPVYTTKTIRSFSLKKIIKTKLTKNMIKDEFLANNKTAYIESGN